MSQWQNCSLQKNVFQYVSSYQIDTSLWYDRKYDPDKKNLITGPQWLQFGLILSLSHIQTLSYASAGSILAHSWKEITLGKHREK